ncbi:DMT family transporter [Sinirhodobacter huangdaonensis]|jgi:drug/metabolite transporter (DMT)-like permease|uniref:DMT family transporter n=1 Tax=Paenirhodobacter huangdaonensis TaxID=2501515 RepID=A0A3S3N9V5_9RHOB|nr:DMT family transporter [Sinirhodobacter huangdaonensis]RWR51525.1 DMT family transporter [Sinirhodobacter huangdaonensis]
MLEITPSPSPARGIALKLGAVVGFVVMQAMIKAVASHVPPGEAVFFRSAFGIVPILVWLAVTHELGGGLRVQSPLGHVWRGVIGTTAMGLGFAALAFLPLPEATAIGYATPILVVVFAALFLGEQVRIVRISAVALGLAGVLVVLWPQFGGAGGGTETLGAGLALAGAACAALAQIQIRRLVGSERTSAIVFWFSFTATVLSLLTLPFGWVMPSPTEAALLIGAGLLGGVAQILMTSAYRFADASVIAPFDYASMLFALGIGYAVFAEIPSASTLAGSALVIAAGVLIIWREHQLGLERRRQRKAMTPQG